MGRKLFPISSVNFGEKGLPVLGVVSMLGLVVFAAHYFRFQQFGFFGDDYAFLTSYVNNKNQSLAFLEYCLSKFFLDALPTGRPLGFWLVIPLTQAGEFIGGKNGVYLVGFFIIWLNATLFYYLLNFRYSRTVSLMGALSYTLFPATTTSAYYTHFVQLNTSFTICLLSCILFMHKYRWLHYLAYLIIPLTLLTYETTILPFFTMPLLRYQWDRTLYKKIFSHISILGCFIAVYAFFRFSNQEQRILDASSNLSETIARTFFSFLIGPYTVAKLHLLRLFTAIEGNDPLGLAIMLVSALSLFVFFCKIQPNCQRDWQSCIKTSIQFRFIKKKIHLSENNFEAVKLLAIGVLSIVFSYALSFTKYPPIQIEGQDTSVHLASSFGWGFFWAALLWLLMDFSGRYEKGKIAMLVISVFFSLLIGFHITVQKLYIQRHDIQKDFWSEVVNLCPDLGDETIIFFETKGIAENKGADNIVSVYGFNPYGEYVRAMTLTALFYFPKNWKRAPVLLNLPSEDELTIRNNEIYWDIKLRNHYEWKVPYSGFLQHENIILLKYVQEKLVRVHDTVNLLGQRFALKKRFKDTKNSYLQKTFVFDR